MLGKCFATELQTPPTTRSLFYKSFCRLSMNRSIILILWRHRQEDFEFRASLSYMVRTCLKKPRRNSLFRLEFDKLSCGIRVLGIFSWMESLTSHPEPEFTLVVAKELKSSGSLLHPKHSLTLPSLLFLVIVYRMDISVFAF